MLYLNEESVEYRLNPLNPGNGTETAIRDMP